MCGGATGSHSTYAHTDRMTASIPTRWAAVNTLCRSSVTTIKCPRLTRAQCRPVLIFCISPIRHVRIVAVMQLRYSSHLYPNTVQRAALAKAFGCARVVFNDAVRTREDARAAGEAFPTAGELSKIGEVRVKWSRALPATPSSVTVLQDAAGRYFASFVIDTDPATDAARMAATSRRSASTWG